ncbi:MAG: hypothetical protein DRH70_07975, partial [Candidatus Coatesbacteria bacterium]
MNQRSPFEEADRSQARQVARVLDAPRTDNVAVVLHGETDGGKYELRCDQGAMVLGQDVGDDGLLHALLILSYPQHDVSHKLAFALRYEYIVNGLERTELAPVEIFRVAHDRVA